MSKRADEPAKVHLNQETWNAMYDDFCERMWVVAVCEDNISDYVTYVVMLQYVRGIVRQSTRFGFGAPLMMVRAFSANQIADMVIVQ